METLTEIHINTAFEEGALGELKSKQTIKKQANGGKLPPGETQKEKQTKEERLFKWGILKNVVVISFAFTCLFTSLLSIANLQSSINRKLGMVSLSMIYAGMVFSTIFLNSIIIKRFTVKWTIALTMLCSLTYIAAQFYPRYYTLVPMSIIAGMGSATLWTAKCKYMITVGEQYAKLVGEKNEVIITRFFGIFFLFHQSSIVLGSLLSSTVFSRDVISVSRSQDYLDHCGANFCPDFAFNLTAKANGVYTTDEAHAQKDQNKITVLSTICLVLGFVASGLVAFFVDSLSKYENKTKSSDNKGDLQLLMATLKQLKNPYQILIVPLTFWIGIEQGFLMADFTASFVTCALGVHMIGYVFICFGVCDAICSFAFTPLVKLVGRVPVFIFGAALNVAMLVVVILWRPDPNQILIFFMIAAFWGVSDSIWETQINAFYGVIFPGETEAAFSNYRLWKSLGYIVSFALSSSICMLYKLYINLGILSIGMACYLTLEIVEFSRKKKETELDNNFKET